jgi:DnaJ like chaperone protein
MQWLGKAIGAALGFTVGGPVGSILGAVLGHQFDQGLGTQLVGGARHTQGLFFEITFEVMGHLAKIDGRVTEEEVRIARRIMHAMRLPPEQVRVAIGHFTRGKAPQYPLRARLADLKSRIGYRRDLTRAFVEIQVQAAVGGGDIAPPKRQLLWEVASTFGMGRAELAQIEALIRAQAQQYSRTVESGIALDAAYGALGLKVSASDKDVKTAYRRLMNQHHPDKLVSRGLPESMIALAEQKTREINTAYERIKAHRGFK